MADRPSLDECLEGVPPGKLGRPCKDVHLCEISLYITNWRAIAPFLGLSKVVEEQIERDEGKTDTQKIAMLRRWREKFGRKATYRRLATVFWKLERADLIDAICDVLVDSSSSSDEESSASEEPVYRDILQRYTHHLRRKYVNEIPNTTQWPPSPTHKVFNLAMIHQMPIQQVPVSDDHIRQTQMGKVDDIMLGKTGIALEGIFNPQHKRYIEERTIVLLEGSPGAGKSTLAWHICKSWGSGSLFGEFTLVMFVQLRDPAIGSATSIADILPGMANGQQREVLSKLEARNGKGVLFVLDGWDEYAKGLSKDNICGKLICCPGDLSMQESTLLITSRPVASGELQKYCSTRIEIIGFTPTEVSKYFREALREAHQEGQHVALLECLEVRPVIQASCYLPLNAAIVVHLFITEGNTLPTTLHSLFTTLVLNCIVRHLKRETEGKGKRLPRLKSLDHIPMEIQLYFSSICALAFHAIKNNQATFSEDDLHSAQLSTDTPEQLLSLLQGWSTFRSSWEELSYSFFHLSIQELLAAYHIHKHCSLSEQVQIFRELFDQPRFAAVLQFYAAFTKFEVEGIHEFLREVVVTNRGPSLITTSQPTMPTANMYKTILDCQYEAQPHKTILDCLYEAQDPSLCQYVAGLMNNELDVDYTVSPLHCMVLGYFLCCIAPTDKHGKFHIHFRNYELDEHNFTYLINELKKCSCGQLALSLNGEGDGWNKTAFAFVRMLEKSCSHCISELKVSLGRGISQDALNEFLLPAKSCGIPRVSLVVTELSGRPESYVIRECNTTGLKTLRVCRWGNVALAQVSLSSVLAVHTTMETLALSQHGHSHPLSSQDARALADALAGNATLKALSLSGHKLPPGGVKTLADSLAGNSSFKELNLSRCKLSSEDLRDLADSLLTNNSLEVLILSQNNLYGEVWDIIHALKVNSALKTLDISYCQLGGRMLEHLVTASKSLETLILSGNDLSYTDCGQTGAHYLAQGLRQNMSLRRLSIEWCMLTDDTMEVIVRALEHHPSMQEINFDGNQFTASGLKTLSESLNKVRHLHKITLGFVGKGMKADQEFTSFVLKLNESRIDCIYTWMHR